LSRRGDMDREWLARASGWLAAVAVSWAVVSALVLYGPQVILDVGRQADVNQVWTTLLGLVGRAGVQETAQAGAATPGPLAWLKALGILVSGLSGILTLFLGPSALTSATRAGQTKERLPFSLI